MQKLLSLCNLPVKKPHIRIHNFSWGELKPLASLHATLENNPVENGTKREALLESELRRSRIQAEKDVFLAWVNHELIGYSQITREERISRAVMTGGVSLGHRRRGVGSLLVERVIAHARQLLFDVLDVEVSPTDEASKRLFKSAGFTHVRTHARYSRTTQEQLRIPVLGPVTIRLIKSSEMKELTDLQNEAFAGSWGYCPNVPEEVRYDIFGLKPTPDPVLILEHMGEMVAYCWCQENGVGYPGTIGMVGVAPRYQGRGFGKIVVGAGVDHLITKGMHPIELTVDANNQSALHLYAQLGFRRTSTVHWYELELGKLGF